MVGREISPVEVEEPPGNTSANQLSADMGAVLSPAILLSRSIFPSFFYVRACIDTHTHTHTHTLIGYIYPAHRLRLGRASPPSPPSPEVSK